jgi:dTDP-4-amino-4,6-dideoxygalactose transaminase
MHRVIPFVDLKAQYQDIRGAVDAAVARVLESGQFVMGAEVEAFERLFAKYLGVEHAIAVNSGTSALLLALRACGIGPGDEVITSSFTFIATVLAIEQAGARPVLVDIDPVSYNLDPARIANAVTPRTRAVLPVHLYGQCADMDAIQAVAGRRGLTVIEDAAQAHGALHGGRKAGSLGRLGCFSFYPSKNLGGCGEGGMVVTSDGDCARSLRILRDCGQASKNRHTLSGYNARMDALQGAILSAKLPHLDRWTDARRVRAAAYDRLLAPSDVVTPWVAPYAHHAYHIYAVRSRDRDGLRERLLAGGIETGVHYPIPVHLQGSTRHLGYSIGDFPHAEQLAREVLSLPMYPELPMTAIDEVASMVRQEVHGR